MPQHGAGGHRSLWTICSVICAALLVVIWSDLGGFGSRLSKQLAPKPAIGGHFKLRATNGATVTEETLTGKPTALFFGYTFCPDVCPTTLYEASSWLAKLGADADGIRIVFVTVDPERDTLDHLTEYMSAFDPRIIGLTGTRKAVDQMITAFRVTAQRAETNEADADPETYLINHTASVYLLDRKGEFVDTIAYQEDAAKALEKIRYLIRS